MAVDEYVRRRPAAPLAGLVTAYSGYRTAGAAPAIHRGLPSPTFTVILTLDDPLDMAAHPDPAQAPGRFDALIGGLHTTPALIRHDGRQSGLQLSLSPLGARTLLGLPAGELTSIDVPAETLWPRVGDLLDRLRAAPSWEQRFDLLDADLLARVRDVTLPPPDVVHAWHRVLTTGGAVGVRELARETGYSERWLTSRFRAEVGLAPKAAARVVRFDRARRLIGARVAAGRPPALAEVAAGCGFYDQAHLAREFGGLAGVAPSAWVAAEFGAFRNVQAAAAAAETE